MKRGLMKGARFLIMSFVLHLFFISFANAGIIEDLFSPFNVSASIKINLAPFITDIGNEILVCENNALSAYFNVTDLDADALGVAITPAFPFFVSPTITSAGQVRTQINIFSGILDKSRVDTSLGYRIYQELLSASDGSLIATKQVNITVIEINNAPNLSNIGVQTVWTQGDDSTFYHQAQVIDIEDGNQNSLNFDFNLTFLDNSPRLFNVSTNGTMIFTPNISEINAGIYNLSVYNISLCVEDRGIGNTHVNISNNCGQDGGPIEVCDTFSLTITDENRPPNITSYYPLNLSFKASATASLYFNLTTRDPDGTIPDIYWYVDDTNVEYTSGNLFDEFRYSFPCGSSGNHSIKAEATDGLLNSSVKWNIEVSFIACPITVSVGGGGGSFYRCQEKWGCLDWGLCQETNFSFKEGLLSREDFNIISKSCKDAFISDNCGFQIRNCLDVNLCNTSAYKPDEVSYCQFISSPSCYDSAKNCHDGGCELLVDCGGPCGACPTCADGIKNQGERGIDCEGPCPLICPQKPPILERLRIGYSLIIFIIILLIIILIQLIRMWRARKRIKSEYY